MRRLYLLMEPDLKTHDVDEYAAIVRHTYGKEAQDFARRMVSRFENSDTEVELFWRTVVESLARHAERPISAPPAVYPGRQVTPTLSAIFVAAIRDLWNGWIDELAARRRLPARVAAPQS